MPFCSEMNLLTFLSRQNAIFQTFKLLYHRFLSLYDMPDTLQKFFISFYEISFMINESKFQSIFFKIANGFTLRYLFIILLLFLN